MIHNVHTSNRPLWFCPCSYDNWFPYYPTLDLLKVALELVIKVVPMTLVSKNLIVEGILVQLQETHTNLAHHLYGCPKPHIS